MSGMGTVRAALLALLVASTGCKGKSDAAAAPDPAAVKAQQELVARRDALMAQRKKLQDEKSQLDAQIQEKDAAGEDTTELKKQKQAIESAIAGQSSDLDSLSTKLDQVATAVGGGANNVAARESSVATREKDFAAREKELADREARMAQREAELNKLKAQECAATAAQPMIIQQVAAPAKPGGYTRKEIEPVLLKARKLMGSKGVSGADLGAASGLDGEATRAMADGEYGKAYLAATQLLATVEQLKIDRSFITAKYKRINDRFASSKLDGAQKAKLEKELQEVVQLYGDGNHVAANKKLNGVSQALK